MSGWVRRLQARWQAYRYRFVPWIALNLKDRKLRSVPKGAQDKIIPDSTVRATLVEFFTALETRGPVNHQPYDSSKETDTSSQPSHKIQSYTGVRDSSSSRPETKDRTDHDSFYSVHGSRTQNTVIESTLSEIYARTWQKRNFEESNLSTQSNILLLRSSCYTNGRFLPKEISFQPLFKMHKTATKLDGSIENNRIMNRKYRTEATVPSAERYQHGLEVMLRTLGFCTERKESSVIGAGKGVFVTRGSVPARTVVSMYPGTMYYPFEPILLQSIANPFIFRCIDGVLIDGNNLRASKMIYRSCAGRDRIGPYLTCDRSWLTQYPKNPLAVGQYVNNQSAGHPANVAYQEYDIEVDFPFHLRKYLPNIHYSPNLQTSQDARYRPVRVVVLVSLRDIEAGEELFSSYFTLVE